MRVTGGKNGMILIEASHLEVIVEGCGTAEDYTHFIYIPVTQFKEILAQGPREVDFVDRVMSKNLEIMSRPV